MTKTQLNAVKKSTTIYSSSSNRSSRIIKTNLRQKKWQFEKNANVSTTFINFAFFAHFFDSNSFFYQNWVMDLRAPRSADRGKRWAGRDFSVPRAAGTYDIIGGAAYNLINCGAEEAKIAPGTQCGPVCGTSRGCIMKMQQKKHKIAFSKHAQNLNFWVHSNPILIKFVLLHLHTEKIVHKNDEILP